MDSQTSARNNTAQSMQTNPSPAGGSLSLAMAYIVTQPPITQVYHPEDALKQGTLFPELVKPFVGSRGAY